jgi:hypothetical protein
MATTKQALRPSEGVYYVVPQKTGSPMIMSRREDEEENVTHMFFWRAVLREIVGEFDISPSDHKALIELYQGIPRGRVQKEIDFDTHKFTGRYVIIHGGDVPVAQIKPFVHQDFGLIPLASQGKVIWKIDDHEKMDPNDRKEFLKVVKK